MFGMALRGLNPANQSKQQNQMMDIDEESLPASTTLIVPTRRQNRSRSPGRSDFAGAPRLAARQERFGVVTEEPPRSERGPRPRHRSSINEISEHQNFSITRGSNARVISRPSNEEQEEPEPLKELREEGKQERCRHWPHCKAGDDCPFVHPSEPCKHFPECSFGDRCVFIHPAIPCRFQDRCQNPSCNYQHRSPASLRVVPAKASPYIAAVNPYQPPSSIVCRFFPNCRNPDCPFVHPIAMDCKFGEGCTRPGCPYMHPAGRSVGHKSLVNAPCRYGKRCSKPDCPFQHPTAEETTVETMVVEEQLPAAPLPENITSV